MEFKLIEPEEVIYNLIFFDIIGILFLETVFYYFYFIASHDQKLKFREKKRKKERKKESPIFQNSSLQFSLFIIV